jgi:hypothetical protein
MMRRKISDELSDTSRKIILIAAVVIAVSAIVFFLWRPIKPALPEDDGFGAPFQTQPASPAPTPTSGG